MKKITVNALLIGTLFFAQHSFGQVVYTEATPADLVGVDWSSSDFGDVNGDGDGNVDLIVSGDDENMSPFVKLYLGDGQGDFTIAPWNNFL